VEQKRILHSIAHKLHKLEGGSGSFLVWRVDMDLAPPNAANGAEA